jgi:UDP-N-acetylmuramate dehydrogenase
MSKINENFQLLDLNTFHVEAYARYFAEFYDFEEVRDFLASGYSSIRPIFVLGGGSNVLFTKNFDGIILHPVLKGIEKTGESDDSVFIRAGAGVVWDDFVDFCVRNEWGGIENLSFIPGTVGASPVQNIGAYGAEIKDVIHQVEAIHLEEGRIMYLNATDCRFAYRDSIFKNELKNKVVITHVVFHLDKNPRYNIAYPDLERELNNHPETRLRTIREAVISIRRNKLPDPAVTGNAGSFFKNPVVDREQASALRKYFPEMRGFEFHDGTVKLSAAWLIEESGWKDKICGKAGTHKKQPLILVNHGGATGEEIFQCALKIQKAVMNHFGIRLEMEVNVL